MTVCECERGAEHRLHMHWHAQGSKEIVCTECMRIVLD